MHLKVCPNRGRERLTSMARALFLSNMTAIVQTGPRARTQNHVFMEKRTLSSYRMYIKKSVSYANMLLMNARSASGFIWGNLTTARHCSVGTNLLHNSSSLKSTCTYMYLSQCSFYLRPYAKRITGRYSEDLSHFPSLFTSGVTSFLGPWVLERGL